MTTSLRRHLDGHTSVRARARALDMATPVSLFRLTGGDGIHHELHLERIICATPEDLLDGDELRIDVLVDGAFERAARRKMRRGDHLRVGWRIPFQDEAVVRLVDEDMLDDTVPLLPSIDRDDILGRAIFTRPLHDQVEIRGDGARYGLNVEVVERPGRLPSAFDLLDEFARSTRPSAWHRIDKHDPTPDRDGTARFTATAPNRTLIEQMEERLLRPWRVNQGPIGLCGPAAVLFELIRTNPRRYVRLMRGLYEQGRFDLGGGNVVRATTALRTRSPWAKEVEANDGSRPIHEVPSADWIALAAIRESADIVKGREQLQSSTNWEAAEWMHELLGLARVEFERTDATGALGFKFPNIGIADAISEAVTFGDLGATDAIRKSVRAQRAGGSVILTINTALLDPPEGWHDLVNQLLGNVSNHLVTLVPRDAQLVDANGDPIPVHNDIDHDGTVNLTLFTWGRIEQVTAPLDVVERELFLAITGTH